MTLSNSRIQLKPHDNVERFIIFYDGTFVLVERDRLDQYGFVHIRLTDEQALLTLAMENSHDQA